uniref:nuclear RNA export factor 3 isoform X1 n=1 Tax=Ictidomys tridecemlineatus TaxID=43179 RepID=UPI001A9F663D|nr:nuclear RNA export factor 3 isoform X1 [Ictidomys tridecemlineatus]
MGHNSQANTLQRRARCWGIFRRRFPNWSEPVSAAMNISSHQQQEGDSAMNDAHMDSGVRYTPYVIPSHHWRSNLSKQDQTHGNMERAQKPPERRTEGNRQNGTLGSWFKITIPFGIKYEEKWLLNLIQSQCNLPFTPVEFHYEKMQAQFFVENASIAFALKNIGDKIRDEDNEKISIFVTPSEVPCSIKDLQSEKVEQVKLTMNKQCDASHQALDIQRPPVEPNLMTHAIEMAPNPRKHMVTSLNIPEKNKPNLSLPTYQLVGMMDTMPKDLSIENPNVSKSKVKSAGKMDSGKGLEPEEMCADRNSLCTTFLDKSNNMNSILELFPKLLCLDGQESPRPTLCGIEAHKKLPTCKGSFFGSDILKNLVLQFLQQYYLIYDYGDRKSLLGTYHIEACFSLTIPFNPKDPALNSFCEYFKYNRDIKKLKDSYQWKQLKHTKRDILDTLCVLPKTRHDLSSFVVDMWFQTETMLCFSVNGLFKEVEGKSQGSVRAFIRTFIAIPGSNSSLCIINDKLFVRDPSPQGNQSPFCIPMATCSSTSVPALSEEQQEMVQAFSVRSGMNLRWSQKFLEENHWDYIRATQVLTMPKVKGMVPEETLKKTDPET